MTVIDAVVINYMDFVLNIVGVGSWNSCDCWSVFRNNSSFVTKHLGVLSHPPT
jgi:hypothetical protein